MSRLAVATIVSLWVIPISILVNRIVPEPYMDEIFHVPQVQQYCRGVFNGWDPMITTPPGLYYLSLVYVSLLFPGTWFTNATLPFSKLCSTLILRSTNSALAVICSIIIYDILMYLRPSLGKRRATLYTVVLSLFPLHWFFIFLYYTDVASLTAVLAMYLFCLKRQYWFSALLGSFAIFIRQTNVVWMLFVACIGAVNYESVNDKYHEQASQSIISTKKIDKSTVNERTKVTPNLRNRRMTSSVNTVNAFDTEMSFLPSVYATGLIDDIKDAIMKLWSLKWEILLAFCPYVLVLGAFVAFLVQNGSIVLGAKEAHAVSLHFAQIMYFGSIAAAAMAPVYFTPGQISVLWQCFWENKLISLLQVLIAVSLGLIAVHFFSIAHPYLLADNRHYPFYIWRKVIKAHWSIKYLLVPLYVYSWLSVFYILGKVQKKIWILLFFLACAAVLIPAPLIEFRYYTIPFYFMAIHSGIDDQWRWFLIGILYMSVNIFTMLMFLYRPFHWDHEPGIQRFIW